MRAIHDAARKRLRHARGLFGGLLFSLLAFVACGAPQPRIAGALCVDGEALCAGPNGSLVCSGGKFVAITCGGKNGCSVDQVHQMVRCDESVASAGMACLRGPWTTSSFACSADAKSFLSCNTDHFEVVGACRGPKGCFREAESLRCDTSMALVGDACSQTGLACSLDGKAALDCVSNKMAIKAKCDGPKGCTMTDSMIRCDGRIGAVGDACLGGLACDAEHKNTLKCESGKLALYQPCRGKGGCAVDADSIACDVSVGEVGDSCESGATCSVDKKSLLKCKDKHLVVERACPKACEVDTSASTVSCR